MGCQASTAEHAVIKDHVSWKVALKKQSFVSSPSPSLLSSIAEASTETESTVEPTTTDEDCDAKMWTPRILRYNIQEKLGEGCFAEVFACVSKSPPQLPCAVKILKAHAEIDQKKARRELEMWRILGTHENIVPLVETVFDGDTFYFVMPRCQYSISKKFSEGMAQDDMLDALHQVFLGLQHCHSLNVIHRDMKAANLLVDFVGKVRIADFGLSVLKPAEGIAGLVGSIPHMSPEMVKQQCYGLETDIWSCGVVAYTLFYGKYTSDQSVQGRRSLWPSERIVAIRENNPAPDYKPVDCMPHPSPKVQTFIEKLLERNPQARPNATLCSKLSLAAKAEYAIEPVMKEDEAERSWRSSWSTICATGVASSQGISSSQLSAYSQPQG